MIDKFLLDKLEKQASNFENTAKKVIVFNKHNGVYTSTLIGVDTSKLDADLYKWKEVEFDSKTHVWDEGDYDNGKVIKLEDRKEFIVETIVNRTAKETIISEYPEHTQSNIIMNMIKKIIDENNMSGSEVAEFKAMHSYIAARRAQNYKYKQAYKNSDDYHYLSRDDQFENSIQIVKGPIEDKFGIAINREK